MRSKFAVRLRVAAWIFVFLLFGWDAQARTKPQVIGHDAHYLETSVNINVTWQSPNPVTLIRVIVGSEIKEVRVDEYDNRRNQEGYSGEATVLVKISPAQHQESIPYILQVEDDLRQKSEQVMGKVKVPSGAPNKSEDDSWGRQHLEKHLPAAPAGKPSPTGPAETVGQIVDAIQGSGGQISIESIEVYPVAPGTVRFVIRINASKPVREILYAVVDTTENLIIQPQVISPNKSWDGTVGPVSLKPGKYKVVVQAVDQEGNPSSEKLQPFSVESGGTSQPKEGAAAGIPKQAESPAQAGPNGNAPKTQ